MAGKNKLELTWIGKDKRPRLEPRILLEDPAFSYHAATRKAGDLFDNVLIKGDNLLALKALEQDYAGKVKCVYLDPPYNTGSAFEHYDDGLEHSIWLGLMRDRLEIIRTLLSYDGHVFIQADDNEGHYLKVIMDEVYGRNNFIATFLWRKVDSPNDNKGAVAPDHEFIFCYAKDIYKSNLKPKPDPDIALAYGQVGADGVRFRDRLLKKNGASSLRSDRPSMYFKIDGPDGEPVFPIHDDGREARWSLGEASVTSLIADGKIVWKQRVVFNKKTWVPYTREYAPANPTKPHSTMWYDLHTMRQAKAHQKEIFGVDGVFSTPKPENLIQRILELSTSDGDLVLDSFAGSGTTGAVAHKMGRRWIMVELGDHCETHVVPRLKKVIDGEDQGGISKAVEWKGGGGYRYFKLAPSLLEKDDFGQWVFSKAYNPQMLTEALCKHFNFTYDPSAEVYWQHGHNSASDFIFVTTTAQSLEQLKALSESVGPDRTLLICCTAFETAHAEAFPNLTLRKIPNAILNSCEWGHDDYSLKIANLPIAEEEDWEFDDEPELAPVKSRKKAKAEADSGDLFGDEQ